VEQFRARRRKGDTRILGERALAGENPFTELVRFVQTYAYNPDDLRGKTPQDSFPGKGVYHSPVSNPNAVYRAMQTDDTVQDALRDLIVGRLDRGWFVTPGGDSATEKEQADTVSWNLDNLPEGNLHHQLKEMMTAVKYGFSVTEMLFENMEWGKYKGFTLLQRFKTRTPDNFRFDVDIHGNLLEDGLIQSVSTPELAVQDRRLQWRGKFVIFTHAGEFANFFGQSTLRACYSAWWMKQFLAKAWGVHLDRYGSPASVATVTTPVFQDATIVADMKKILKNLQAGTGIMVPEGVEIELLEAAHRGNAGFKDAFNIQRERIRHAILGKNAEKVPLAIIDLGRELEAVLNDQFVPTLVDLNWETVKSYPTFHFAPPYDSQAMEKVKTAVDGVGAGAMTADLGLEQWGRLSLGIPPISDEEWEKQHKKKEAAPAPPAETPKMPDEQQKAIPPQPGEPQPRGTTDDKSLNEQITKLRFQISTMMKQKGIVDRQAENELAALVKRVSTRHLVAELTQQIYNEGISAPADG
jgi:phage gp29-like protein